MLKSKKVALASVITIFLLGLILGIVADRYLLLRYFHSGHKRGQIDLVQMFKKELNLTVEQQEKLKELLAELREEHEKIRKSTKPDYKRINREFREKFSKVLDEEQKKKFNELNERFDKRRKRRN